MTATHAGQMLANGLQPLSCLRCANRKVRCDRIVPCSNCIKHDVGCEFPQPRTEKRQRRKVVDVSSSSSPSSSSSSSSLSSNRLRARLGRYQEMLKDLGVDVESIPHSAHGTVVSAPMRDTPARHRTVDDSAARGRLFVNENGSRYIEGNLWTRIGEDLTAGIVLPDSPSDDMDDEEGAADTSTAYLHGTSYLTLGLPALSSGSVSTEELYPPQQHFLQLWQAYLSHIHPVTMILHGPSDGETLARAVKDRGHASRDVDALLFATMACALISVADADCVRLLGEKRSALFSRYRLGCEVALANANFLISSSLRVLQAYTIYLVAIGPHIDPCELWNLAGIARRNAQRLGLHHAITTAGLTPFELEMRRRLWSQIVMNDAVSSQAAGLYRPENNFDITSPNNVNDADLSPGMNHPPKERAGPTDMIFCNLRYKLMKYMGEVNGGEKPWVLSKSEKGSSAAGQCYRAERDKEIGEMEEMMELELLRYCDLLNPVHFLTVIIARLAVCKLRYTSLQLCRYGKDQTDYKEEDRELMYTTALKVLEHYNNVHSHPFVRGFLWHTQQHFQWSCLIHILADLKQHPCSEQADTAWKHIHMLYEFRPDLYQGQTFKLPLYKSINKMTIEAWQSREIGASERGKTLIIPTYIAMLQGQAHRAKHKRQALNMQSPSTVSSSQTLIDPSNDELLSLNNTFAQESAGWSNWTGCNMMASYPAGHGMYLLDPMLDQSMSMSAQSHNVSSYQAHSHIPRIDRSLQGGPPY